MASGCQLIVLVELHHPVFDARRLHEPRVDRVRHQRRALAPVVGVVVDVGVLAPEQASGGEIADDRAVGVFEPEAAADGEALGKRAVGLDGVEHRDALARARQRVVGAEGGRGVDDARAVVGRDVVGAHDPPEAVALRTLRRLWRGRRTTRPPRASWAGCSAWPMRSAPVRCSTITAFSSLMFAAMRLSATIRCSWPPPSLGDADFDVLDLRPDAHRGVAGNGPRRRRPRQERRVRVRPPEAHGR